MDNHGANSAKESQKLWKSLDDFEGNKPQAKKLNHLEMGFISRREFLEWMGGVGAVVGASSCTRQPVEKIVPYVKAPEYVVPGKPLFFATTADVAGDSIGVLVESHTGRPTKVEGNPEHPASLGATSSFAQASILDLYDPDRAKNPQYKGIPSTWDLFVKDMDALMARQGVVQGIGIRLVTRSVSSPTLLAQIQSFLKKYPKAKWVVYEPLHKDNSFEGAKVAFGEALSFSYNVSEANIVVSFDSDFMGTGKGSVRNAREFSKRRFSKNFEGINRFYAFESMPTVTGSLADHKLVVAPHEAYRVLWALAQACGMPLPQSPSVPDEVSQFVRVLASDLKKNQGKSLLVAGEHLAPACHALVHAINSFLGNFGKTVFAYGDVPEEEVGQEARLQELAADLEAGKVEALFLLDSNLVYHAPRNFDFSQLITKAPVKVSLSYHLDETAAISDWQLPLSHYLEAWGDSKGFDGTVGAVQPLIAPLYQSKSKIEVLSILSGKAAESGYDSVRNFWKTKFPSVAFEKFWRKSVHDGKVAGSESKEKKVSLKPQGSWFAPGSVTTDIPKVEVRFCADPSLWDGTFANNAWLQELPRPFSKLTWDNVAYISPVAAKEWKVENGEVIQLVSGKKTIECPVWIMPGVAKHLVAITLGYGRKRSGRVGSNIGYDAYTLRSTEKPWLTSDVQVAKVGRKHPLASTQTHFNMEGREIVLSAPISEYLKKPDLFKPAHESSGLEHGEVEIARETKGKPFEDKNYAWGMAINLSVCNGCNACVVACQSENNISVVGKEEVRRGRAMHWLRIDQYYEGSPDNPKVFSQPTPCMHCESAPCEIVCPVNATSHSPDGLNEMTYNRCVGTKYCSNNCPYKVRHFNFYAYADISTPTLQLSHNPDVTVRSRGVMEKCTYCVQRISQAKITAKKDSRLVKDGEFTTACASACPTQAITFGNIKDSSSEVAELKKSPLNYSLLEELATHPRTTYLAQINNPNPELQKGSQE